MISNYDELNILPIEEPSVETSNDDYKERAVPFEEYFGEMDLTDEEKQERVTAATDFETDLLFLFILISLYQQYQITDTQNINTNVKENYTNSIVNTFKNKYKDTLSKHIELDSYMNDYLSNFAQTTVETTLNHLDDKYYLSNDRAAYIAENEVNTVYNYKQFVDAINNGKTTKKWIDIRDKRERETHLKVGGKTKPIQEPFIVGDSLMQFPKDESLNADPKEIVNCRCTIKYF